MPFKTTKFRFLVRDALRSQEAIWTPECPEPETLLDWLAQGDFHPRASWLLDHIIGCGYCRHQRAILQEIQALTRGSATHRVGIPKGAALPGRVGSWVTDLIAEGIVAPIKSPQASWNRMSKFNLSTATAIAARDTNAPLVLSPTKTAIRTTQPVLRWLEAQSAPHEVLILRQSTQKRRQMIWRGLAASSGQLTLPNEAGLEPGAVYVWQAIAQEEYPSPVASFVILSERLRGELESLEASLEPVSLARVALYEAYGLYEEAGEVAESLLQIDPHDEVAQRIRTELQNRLSAS